MKQQQQKKRKNQMATKIPKTVKTASAFVKLCKETAKISAQVDTLREKSAKLHASSEKIRAKRIAKLEENLRKATAVRSIKLADKIRNLTAKLDENRKAISGSDFK